MLARHRHLAWPALFVLAASAVACGSADEAEPEPLVLETKSARDMDAGSTDEATEPEVETGGDGGTDQPSGDGGADQPSGDGTVGSCSSAIDIGTVNGDADGKDVLAHGKTNAWVKVRVTEASGGVFGHDQSFAATLSVPSSCDFDLYAYVDTEKDELACGAGETARSTNVGTQPDTIGLRWGEGWSPNWADDSRTVVFEIRKMSTNCKPNDTWSLAVEGNVEKQ